MAMDPYSVLGVERGASQDDVKKAYRKKADRKYCQRPSIFQQGNCFFMLVRVPEHKTLWHKRLRSQGIAQQDDFPFDFRRPKFF